MYINYTNKTVVPCCNRKTGKPIWRGILLLALLLFCASITRGQNITANFKKASLRAVIKELKKQSHYDFWVTDDLLNSAAPVDLQVVNKDIKATLEQLFKDGPLTYIIREHSVIIREKPVAPSPQRENGNTPGKEISGMVRDSLNHAVIGATVKLSPGKFITATVKAGLFNLSDVPVGNYTLTVTSIGYRPLEINIEVNEGTKSDFLSLVVNQAIFSLNEVPISTGYQHIKPEQSTGAVSRINTKEYESQISTDFLDGLVNKLPGLLINPNVSFTQILPNGSKTTNSLFQIRGLSTISGNQSPLIVIDGYPTELTLDLIDPNEIKSVTILKDAAAATVYGVRASNGVIVIERKQAEEGVTKFSFRSTFGFTPKENYSRYRWAKDGSDININYDKAIYGSTITPTTWDAVLSQNTADATIKYPAPVYIMAQQAAGVITADQANGLYSQLSSYNNATEYSRLFLRYATTQTYNLDMSGGNKSALYYITANYTGNTLEQDNNNNSHFLLSGRTTLNFTKRFSLELTTDYQEELSKTAPAPNINSFYPYEHFIDASGTPAPTYFNSPVSSYYNNYLMSQGLLNDLYYPLLDMNLIQNQVHTINNRFTANFNYKIGNGLDLSFGGVYERSHTDVSDLANAGSSIVNQAFDTYIGSGSSGPVFYLPKEGGYLEDETAITRTYTVRAQLNYNKHIGNDHSINAILGTEVRDVTAQTNSASYFGYNSQTLLQQPVDYATLFNGSYVNPYGLYSGLLSYNGLFNQGYTDDRFISGYSNVVYTYRNRYSLTGSGRIDQSNLFGTNSKYHYKPLWSVGAGWNIDQEDFMKSINWVKSLKLRIAYGFDGNVAKLALPQVIAKSSLNYSTDPISSQLQLLSLANSGLRWEQTQNFNLGLDYHIFRNITGSIDYYNKKSTDLLANGLIDPALGATSALINTASIRNHGLEAALHADWITSKNFNWNTGLVFVVNTSKVLQVYNTGLEADKYSYQYAGSGANNAYVKNYPVGAIFDYRYAGLDNTGTPMIFGSDGKKKSFDILGPISDVSYSGSSIPTRNAGLSNRFDIGNFYFYAIINYYGGFKVLVPPPLASATRPLAGAGNFWQHPGDENQPGIMPSLAWQNVFGTYLSDFNTYVVNGDYFTLGDLTASYNIGDLPVFKKIGFSRFEVKLQAANVYTRALNKFDYSVATGSYYKSYTTPTYTVGLFTNF